MSSDSIVLYTIEFLTYRRIPIVAHLENGVLKTKDGELVYIDGYTDCSEAWPPEQSGYKEAYFAVTDPELIKMVSTHLKSPSEWGKIPLVSDDIVAYISKKYRIDPEIAPDFRMDIRTLRKGCRFTVVPGDGVRAIAEIIYEN